ncbi:hypothetical protein LV89_03758 [Arcicella aurantiaca]|uniref:IPT/TIG domain-containing protein n=1 Tax=Arcicella aurantiaca TaxID=591202 RepID=A0A316DRW0_9BACT|nr:hypothetical protein [Arcicella aurantiaca]PWK20218.1 hypothetical protein LV89_03758 [Arcicella aurantiaca]
MKKYLHAFLFILPSLVYLSSCSSELPELKVPQSSQKQLLSFKFLDFNPVADGDIDTSTRKVKVRVPVGTKVTALIPTLTVSSQATSFPQSLVAQNFTKPVTYMVTAADCTKRAFEVTVEVALTTDPEITGIETISAKTTDSFFIYGKNLTRTGAITKFFLTSKLTGKTYDLSNVSLTTTQAKVQIPHDVPVGLYSITVDVNGRQVKYRTLDLKITGIGTQIIIDRMTVLAYIRGQDLIITGNNIKATKVQIRFQPQLGSTTQLKDAVLNAEGTEIKYKIETTFPAPYRWTLTVLLDGVSYALPDLVTITAK